MADSKQKRFCDSEFWEDGYQDGGQFTEFEWYISPEETVKQLLLCSKPTDRVLMIGCGMSNVSALLYQAGVEKITNIDISESCIQKMQARCSTDMPKMQWLAMDALNMQFEDNCFDLVIDKATSDAMFATSRAERPKALQTIRKMFDEVRRVVDPAGGRFVQITRHHPSVYKDLYTAAFPATWCPPSSLVVDTPRVYGGKCYFSLFSPVPLQDKTGFVPIDLDAQISDDDTSSDDASFKAADDHDDEEDDDDDDGSEEDEGEEEEDD